MLGLFLSLVVVCAWREATGEMPYRWAVFLVVSVGYMFAVEIASQGWESGDSWFDCLMVSLGSAGVLFPFLEVSAGDGVTTLILSHTVLAWFISVWAVMLSARVLRRVRAWN
jgi:hypothetical protein